jgi:hypothetical protein
MSIPITVTALVLMSLTVFTQDRARRENSTRKITVEAPASWDVRSEPYVLSVSAVAGPSDLFTPTVSMMIEPVSGERKRLKPYVQSFYSHNWLMLENMQGWTARDTTWDGLQASVADFTSSYSGAIMSTRVIMAVEGDSAYVSRAMWLNDATPQQIDTALAVLRTAKRVKRSK